MDSKESRSEPIEEKIVSMRSAGEEGADEGSREAGDHDQHRIAEDVAVEHLSLGQALHARGEHVLLADLVEERVLREQGRGGEAPRAPWR